MNKKTIIVMVLILIPIIAIANDTPYFNKTGHFYLQIPTDWTEIPYQEIRAFEAAMGVKNKYLTGFYTKPKTNNVYPYILIERIDLGRKITMQEIQQGKNKYNDYIKKNTAMLGKTNATMRRLQNEYGLRDVKPFQEAVYDDKKYIAHINMIVSTADGNFISHMALVFYRDGYLQILCYAKESEYVHYSPLFDNFITSISFENTYQYSASDTGSKAIESKLTDAETYYNQGNSSFKAGNTQQAVEYFSKAIELNPRYSQAYYNRGVVYRNSGKNEQAIRDYNKAIELNPNLVEAYCNRGVIYYESGNTDKAIKDYSRAIELNPKDAETYYNRANAYHKVGKYRQALKDFNKSIELNPRYTEAYYNRGVIYQNILGNAQQAIKEFSKAIELNPRFAEAYFNRAVAHNNLGNTQQSNKDYSKAIELNPALANR